MSIIKWKTGRINYNAYDSPLLLLPPRPPPPTKKKSYFIFEVTQCRKNIIANICFSHKKQSKTSPKSSSKRTFPSLILGRRQDFSRPFSLLPCPRGKGGERRKRKKIQRGRRSKKKKKKKKKKEKLEIITTQYNDTRTQNKIKKNLKTSQSVLVRHRLRTRVK